MAGVLVVRLLQEYHAAAGAAGKGPCALPGYLLGSCTRLAGFWF